jgi:branched-chain amino acid aminotransferase
MTAPDDPALDDPAAWRPAVADRWVFHDGEILRANEVSLGPSTQGLHYGTGVFEGIRSYRSEREAGVSHLVSAPEHYRRLRHSARLLRLDLPYTPDELTDITVELLRRNRHTGDSYVRPIVHKLALEPGVPPGVRLRGVTTSVSVLTMPMPPYAKADGIRCQVSSWRRIPDVSLPTRAKICGGYANNALAVDEAEAAGFDDAIFLNTRGEVSEATTANIFLVSSGRVYTPGPGADILEGITRGAVIEILREEAGLDVSQRSIARSELYTADEVFLTGTGCEIVPVLEVDHRPVGDGSVGPLTKLVQHAYQDLVRGRGQKFADKLTRVEFTEAERDAR